MKQSTLFKNDIYSVSGIEKPSSYKGLSSFHKYWGKKPVESLSYLINVCTKESDLVVDPFLGSGLVAREAASLNRRFVGSDINPVAIELAKLVLFLPGTKELKQALRDIKEHCENSINQSYRLSSGGIASHYLWEGSDLIQVWSSNGRKKDVLEPTEWDLSLIRKYEDYCSVHVREMKFYTNSRINAASHLTANDIFTGRALRNIDQIIEGIDVFDSEIKNALMLSLTSASGQMSRMVFAIQNRARNGSTTRKIEVGSWVIGFWRPKLHFEINVWNCFERRVKKLIKAIDGLDDSVRYDYSDCIEGVTGNHINTAILNKDATDTLSNIPSSSVSLVITDPPHNDRIPYLEMSEIWNAILNKHPDFENEVVISNAKERGKTRNDYIDKMKSVMSEISRVLKQDGVLAFYYNSRHENTWDFLLDEFVSTIDLRFRGCFPIAYSARSVVQDNRKGALKGDYVFIYTKANASNGAIANMLAIPNWSNSMPINRS